MTLQASAVNKALALGIFLCLFSHIPNFFSFHDEGDEIVYVGLSDVMGWDFSNYTIKDHPIASQFTQKLYKAPVFYHPPIFPWLLKFFGLFGNKIILGLLFNVLLHIGTAILVYKILLLLTDTSEAALLGFFYAVLCPILTATLSRLHLDGLFAFILLLSLWFLLMILHQPTQLRWWIGAGISVAILLNT